MAMHEYQKQMYKKVGVIAALIILPIAGFFAGTMYQKQTATDAPVDGQRSGQRGQFGEMMKNRAVGTVKSITDTSITVTSRMDNTDKTYTLTSSTTYKDGTTTAQLSDVKADDSVMLTLDSSDSTKVKTITINPVMGGPSSQGQPQSSGTSLQ
jgi:hypothetical protein